ncbi:MAG TPA: HlyD family secretion protein [Candidatus Angelobacter sp.]
MAAQTVVAPERTEENREKPVVRKPVEIPIREPEPVVPKPVQDNEKPKRGTKIAAMIKRHPVITLFVLLLVAAVVSASWLYFSSYEETDDAQVDGHLNPVSARISGTILTVNPAVEDNHYVKAGTVLAEIDPADLQAEVDRARADYERLRASASAAQEDVTVISSSSNGKLNLADASVHEAADSIAAEKASLESAQARLVQAEAGYTRAEADRQRYERLLAKREISQSEYDRISTEATTGHAAVNAARADLDAAGRRVGQAENRLVERKADLFAAHSAPEQVKSSVAKAAAAASEADRARAQLTAAELNLSYTKIIAPVSGVIGRKSIEVGQRIQPGQQLLSIVPVDDVWVTANFKETQLQKMRPGQAVTIHLDSYDRDYHGRIEDLGGATGSRFSLLPPENATGNYVKVVQRVAVRILLDQGENSDRLLRPGMSVEAKVKLR